jgi:tRNA G18 (ribose-2'-O)-methylase SpoU
LLLNAEEDLQRMIQLVKRKRLLRHEILTKTRHSISVLSWADDPNNIGSLTRICEAFFVKKLYTSKHPSKKTAVGALKWQPLEVIDDPEEVLYGFEKEQIVALEITDHSVMLPTKLPEKMCLLVGNETLGIPVEILEKCGKIVEIPQYGAVGSLNVATACGIALYEWSSQWAVK